jgi:hypothetical protein
MGISCDTQSIFGYFGFVMCVPVCPALAATLPMKFSGSIDEPFADTDRSLKSRIIPVRIKRCWANFRRFRPWTDTFRRSGHLLPGRVRLGTSGRQYGLLTHYCGCLTRLTRMRGINLSAFTSRWCFDWLDPRVFKKLTQTTLFKR